MVAKIKAAAGSELAAAFQIAGEASNAAIAIAAIRKKHEAAISSAKAKAS